jgi:cell division protein FtsI/penicillin-binding protein 2
MPEFDVTDLLTIQYYIVEIAESIVYDSIKSIIGTTGSITKEKKEEYLSKGYSLDDEVGTSYLEEQYEEYLRGKKAVYKVNNDNSLTLIEEEQRGKDLYLTIDINIQEQSQEIIKKYLRLNILLLSIVILS